MVGFNKDQLGNFDPTAVAGFNKEQLGNFDPTAMAGFNGDQVKNFDPAAVAGFKSDQVMEMDSAAVEEFGADQVRNLLPESKIAVGDKIETFVNVGIDVRQELVAQPQRRLGGVGSFNDLAKSLMNSSSPSSTEGWDVAQIETISSSISFNNSSNDNVGVATSLFSQLAFFSKG